MLELSERDFGGLAVPERITAGKVEGRIPG
jgi:hypothetical protein